MATGKRVVHKIHLEFGPAIVELEGESLDLEAALDLFAGLVANAPPVRRELEGGGSADLAFGFSAPPLCDTEERLTDGL